MAYSLHQSQRQPNDPHSSCIYTKFWDRGQLEIRNSVHLLTFCESPVSHYFSVSSMVWMEDQLLGREGKSSEALGKRSRQVPMYLYLNRISSINASIYQRCSPEGQTFLVTYKIYFDLQQTSRNGPVRAQWDGMLKRWRSSIYFNMLSAGAHHQHQILHQSWEI